MTQFGGCSDACRPFSDHFVCAAVVISRQTQHLSMFGRSKDNLWVWLGSILLPKWQGNDESFPMMHQRPNLMAVVMLDVRFLTVLLGGDAEVRWCIPTLGRIWLASWGGLGSILLSKW